MNLLQKKINRYDDSKIHKKLQGNQNSQNSLEKAEQNWEIRTSQLQNRLQSHSNEGSVMPAQDR